MRNPEQDNKPRLAAKTQISKGHDVAMRRDAQLLSALDLDVYLDFEYDLTN